MAARYLRRIVSAISMPKPPSPTYWRSLVVITAIERMPRSRRIWAPRPTLRQRCMRSRALPWRSPCSAVERLWRELAVGGFLDRFADAEEDDDAAAAAALDLLDRLLDGVSIAVGDAEEIDERTFALDADGHVLLARDVADDERDRLHLVERGLVDIGLGVEAADRGGNDCNALEERLVLKAVGDEVLDRDDLEAVLAGEGDELGEPLHRAVVVDDFGEDAGGLEPGEAREIDAGLGVA